MVIADPRDASASKNGLCGVSASETGADHTGPVKWREERSLVCGQMKSARPDRRNSICLWKGPIYRSTRSRGSCAFLSARSEAADSRAPVTDVAQSSHLNLKPPTCTAQNTENSAARLLNFLC